jgi:hypothetical protein
MVNRFYSLARRTFPLLSAGVLVQTGGCAIDTDTIINGLVTSIANSLISSLVFGAFNVVGV